MSDILIIVENKTYCDSLSGIVRGMGHEVICTDTLKGGLQELRSRNFDVVFLEVQMPDGNGLDVLSEILENPSPPEVIIITDFKDGRQSSGEDQPGQEGYGEVVKAAAHHAPACPSAPGWGCMIH